MVLAEGAEERAVRTNSGDLISKTRGRLNATADEQISFRVAREARELLSDRRSGTCAERALRPHDETRPRRRRGPRELAR